MSQRTSTTIAARRADGRLYHRLIAPVLVSLVLLGVALLGVACAAEEAATEPDAETAGEPDAVSSVAAVCVSRGEEDLRPLLQLVTEECEPQEYRTVLEQVRAECESRKGHTELLLLNKLHVCYEVTVLDDGWRLCDMSLPRLIVTAPADWHREYPYPCGNTPEQPEVVESLRDECEARAGHTELLPYDTGFYACYEVTVLDDGWRTCAYSLPSLEVRAVAPYDPEYYPCGELGPEWPFAIEAAPADCESARDWYADYWESVVDEMNRVGALSDAAAVQSWLSDLGHLFEQNGRRAEAAQAACTTGDTLGSSLAISEAERGFDEIYHNIVVGCLTDGIHDCTVLAPTPKVTCEKRDPRFGYVLDEFALADWPYTAASGCSLRG